MAAASISIGAVTTVSILFLQLPQSLKTVQKALIKQLKSFVIQTTTVGITATKQAAAILAPVSSLNVTVVAASQNTGPVMGTMTVETIVTRLMPTVPTGVRSTTWWQNCLLLSCVTNFKKCLLINVMYLVEILVPWQNCFSLFTLCFLLSYVNNEIFTVSCAVHSPACFFSSTYFLQILSISLLRMSWWFVVK